MKFKPNKKPKADESESESAEEQPITKIHNKVPHFLYRKPQMLLSHKRKKYCQKSQRRLKIISWTKSV